MFEQILDKIVARLENRPAAQDENLEERTQIAVAALLIELARIDADFADSERDAIKRSVREMFGIEPRVTEALIAVAERKVEEVWHNFLFTEAIKKGFDTEGRVQLIRKLGQVACADGVLHHLEYQMVQQVVRELEIPSDEVEKLKQEHERRTAAEAGENQ